MSHRMYRYNKTEVGSAADACLPLMEWGYALADKLLAERRKPGLLARLLGCAD